MKNKVLIIALTSLLIGGMSLIISCNGGGDTAGTEAVAVAKYVCPMHADETSNEEGSTCGKCGMDLVLAESLNAEAEPETEPETPEAVEMDSTSMDADSNGMEAIEEMEMEMEEEVHDHDDHEGHNH